MSRFFSLTVASLFLLSCAYGAEPGKDISRPTKEAASKETLDFTLRSRAASTNSPGRFEVVQKAVHWDPHKTAAIICDMWDRHWCKSATARVAEMAPRMNQVIGKLREQGVFIVHCPSETMQFYASDPGRKLALAAPMPLQSRNKRAIAEGPFPIDASDGGCDDDPPCQQGNPWRREIAALDIKPGDAIDDSPRVLSLLRQRGIENVIVMGVHTNMCVLDRPFAIRALVGQELHVALMRDMTDVMYNHKLLAQRRPLYGHRSRRGIHREVLVPDAHERPGSRRQAVSFRGGRTRQRTAVARM